MTAPVAPTAAPPAEPGDPGFTSGDDKVDSVHEQGSAQYEDYWGFDETEKWLLPDKKQYIEFKRMNEGARANFQKKTTRDVTLVRNTGDAKMRVDPATERYELMAASVVNWHIVRKNPKNEFEPVPFSIGSPGANFEQWYNNANPKLIDELEAAIRKVNPWLLSEMTTEDIDKEMDRLRELREDIVARERGESSSGSK